MTIALTTPAEINMWVLLSRRSQLKLQMKGIKTPGIIKWCKENLGPEATTSKRALLMLNDLISEQGGPNDPEQHVLVALASSPASTYAIDAGIYPNMEAVEAVESFTTAYRDGCLHIIHTSDDVRGPKAGLMYQFQ
jgi:hypothetical protein